MTEVPEHLLRRSKERKAALSGEGGDAATADASAAPAGGAVEKAPAAAAAPRAAAPAAPAYVGPPQPPPKRPRLPIWAMPVVAALPFWAMLYAGAFGERPVEPTGLLAEGQTIYQANCAGCHGAQGGGGVGPAMDGVAATFPEFADHVAWIKSGSAPFKGQPYGATGKIATGGMPAIALEEEEYLAVACYERVVLAGVEEVPECEEDAEGVVPGADTEGPGTVAEASEEETASSEGGEEE